MRQFMVDDVALLLSAEAGDIQRQQDGGKGKSIGDGTRQVVCPYQFDAG